MDESRTRLPWPPGRLFATVPEFVEVTGYDARTVRKGIEAGEIPAIRVGVTWRIPVTWIRQQAKLPAEDGQEG
jgi:excisionase family DNA binding protein